MTLTKLLELQQSSIEEYNGTPECKNCGLSGKLLLKEIQKKEREAYLKGLKEATKLNDSLEDTEEAHRTEEGYCCVCGCDMAVMPEKIEQTRQDLISEILSKLPEEKDNELFDKSLDTRIGMGVSGFKDGYNQAIQEVKKLLEDL